MIIKRNKVNLVKKMKIKERKISFKRIEPWIPQARAATKRGFLDARAAAKREQFQQLPAARAVPAPCAVRAVPAAQAVSGKPCECVC